MAEHPLDLENVYGDVKAYFEADSTLMAMLAHTSLFYEEVPAHEFPAMILHSVEKSDEGHLSIGKEYPDANLVCPFEIVSSSKKSDGSTQTLAEQRTEAYAILKQAEVALRNDPHMGDSSQYMYVRPGAVSVVIVRREDYVTFHCQAEVLIRTIF